MPNSNGPRRGTRSKLSNHPRKRGTSPPQRRIEVFEEGDTVHLAIDPSLPNPFHPRFNGLTGTVVGTQGSAFKVEINDGGKQKTIITRAEHLKAQE